MITIGTLRKKLNALRKHTHKKTDRRKVMPISYEANKIVEKLSINNRIEKIQETEAFVTIKDHKEGFSHHVSCRLLSLSKTNIRKIIKVLLDKINSAVLSSTKINKWKNKSSLLNGLRKSHANKLHHLDVLM